MIQFHVEKQWADLLHVLKQHVDEVNAEEISMVDVQAAEHVAKVLRDKVERLHQKARDMRDNH